VGKTKTKKTSKSSGKKPKAKPQPRAKHQPRSAGSKGAPSSRRSSKPSRGGGHQDPLRSDPAGDRLLERLQVGGLKLLVEREGRLAHASDRGGLRPLYEGIIEHPELFEGADVADRIVGLAAANLLVHARVARVATTLISRDAERALTEAGISFTARSRVKELEDVALADGVGVEQLARDSVTPATFVEALRTRFG